MLVPLLIYHVWEGIRRGEAEGEAALEQGGEVAITFVDDEKFIMLRPGEERASHKRGRKPLREFWGEVGGGLLFDIPLQPVLLVLACMGRPRENARLAIGDEISLGWVDG